jgi:hypothetical protein
MMLADNKLRDEAEPRLVKMELGIWDLVDIGEHGGIGTGRDRTTVNFKSTECLPNHGTFG